MQLLDSFYNTACKFEHECPLLFLQKWRICFICFIICLIWVYWSRHTRIIVCGDFSSFIVSVRQSPPERPLRVDEGGQHRGACVFSPSLPQMIQIWATTRWKQAGILLTGRVGWDQLEPDWGFFLRVTNFKLWKSAEASLSVDALSVHTGKHTHTYCMPHSHIHIIIKLWKSKEKFKKLK